MDLSLIRQYYETWDDAYDDLQTSAMAQGFAFRILRSHKDNNGHFIRYDLVCVCHGNPPAYNPNRRRQERSTMKCGCSFSAKAVYRQQERLWELIVVNNEHNHQPHDRPDTMCAHRRRLRQQDALFETRLERLSLLATKSSAEIANELEDIYLNADGNKTKKVTAQDVRNSQEALRRRKYGPYSSTQIFLCILRDSPGTVHRIHRGNDGKIDSVFFSFEWALEQWKKNPEIVSFDNTYKVNRFNMPLLQITGITALYTTFTAAFCLVSSEVEAAFQWPLEVLRELAEQRGIPHPQIILSDMCLAFKNAAESVFPQSQQQLCIWHTSKNVLHYIRTHWNGENDAHDIVVDTDNNDGDDDEEALNQFLQPPQRRQGAAAGGRNFEDSVNGCIQA